MHSTIITIIFLLSIENALTMYITKDKIPCGEESFIKLNSCFNQYMMLEKGHLDIPIGLEEANSWCKKANESLHCISSLAPKCLPSTSIASVKALTFREINASCPQATNELAKKMSCLAQQGSSIGQLMFNFSTILFKSSRTQVSICCKVFFLKESLISIGYKNCDEQSMVYINNFLDRFSKRFEDSTCAKIVPKKEESCGIKSVEEDEDDEKVDKDESSTSNMTIKYFNPFLALLLASHEPVVGAN